MGRTQKAFVLVPADIGPVVVVVGACVSVGETLDVAGVLLEGSTIHGDGTRYLLQLEGSVKQQSATQRLKGLARPVAYSNLAQAVSLLQTSRASFFMKHPFRLIKVPFINSAVAAKQLKSNDKAISTNYFTKKNSECRMQCGRPTDSITIVYFEFKLKGAEVLNVPVIALLLFLLYLVRRLRFLT